MKVNVLRYNQKDKVISTPVEITQLSKTVYFLPDTEVKGWGELVLLVKGIYRTFQGYYLQEIQDNLDHISLNMSDDEVIDQIRQNNFISDLDIAFYKKLGLDIKELIEIREKFFADKRKEKEKINQQRIEHDKIKKEAYEKFLDQEFAKLKEDQDILIESLLDLIQKNNIERAARTLGAISKLKYKKK